MKRKFKVVSVLLSAAMLAAAFSGCGTKKQTVSKDGVVNLKWYLRGVMDGNDCQEVFDSVNDILEERYKLHVDFSFIDGGNFASKLNAINAAYEEYDLVFTSNWANDFYQNVVNGTLMDITDLLPEYAPTVYKNTSEAVWKAVSDNDRIYAVPNWQEQARSCGLIIDQDKLDKAGMTIDEINTMDDLTTYLRKIHAIEPKSDAISIDWNFLAYKFGYADTGISSVSFKFGESGKPVLVNIYETEEYKNFVKLLDSWVKEGLIRNYIATDTQQNEIKKEVRTNLFMIAGYAPGSDVDMSVSRGYDVAVKKFSDDAVLTTSGILAAATGVAATSKHPEEAVKMIEIMNTDKEIFNMLCWGIEGKHYTKEDDMHIKLVENSAYNCIADFSIGSAANSYVVDGQDENIWERIKEYNDSAIPSSLLGINFNTEKIQSQLADCATVISKETAELNHGVCSDVDAALNTLLKDLKTAGIDKVIEELQSQVDEWWKQNNE